MLYIDKYIIKKLGDKYNPKKDKHDKNQTLFEASSDEGINGKRFMRMLDDLDDNVNIHGCRVEINVTFIEGN